MLIIILAIAGLVIAPTWEISCTQKVFAQQPSEEELVVGTWDGLKPNTEGVVWIFKEDGTMKKTGDSEYVPYELVNGASGLNVLIRE